MTDKETIIDGVDVSECEFLWKEKLPKKVCNNGNLDCDCSSNLNYIFKQFQRQEQKLEKIRNMVTDIDGLIQDYETAYDLAVDILQIIGGKIDGR